MIKALVKVKIYWNLGMGYLSLPKDALQLYLLGGTFAGVWHLASLQAVTILGIILVIGVLIFGWTIYHKGIIATENSLMNQKNPELMEIVKNTNKPATIIKEPINFFEEQE